MTSPVQRLHDDKVAELAAEYAQRGFEVHTGAEPGLLPFDLGGYRPDLVARRGETGLIVEVNPQSSRAPVDRYLALAREIGRHAGWRFLLVTLDDVDANGTPTSAQELPSWAELGERLQRTRALAAAGDRQPALLFGWSLLEAALRRRALEQGIPAERLPPARLLEQMVTLGEVPVGRFPPLRDCLALRNRIAHGFNDRVDAAELEQWLQAVEGLLHDWASAAAT